MSETGVVTIGTTELHYEVAGAGPAVLFLHAGVADSRMWSSQLETFATSHRVVAFDQRGFGKTPWVAGPYADWKDAVAVMDHLDIGSAVMVGCSNGGGFAMHLALAVPDRVDGLVLIGAAARGWEPAEGWFEPPEWDEAVKAFKAGDIARVVDLDAQIWLVGQGRSLTDIDPALVELFRDMDRVPATTESDRNEDVESFEPPVNDRLDDIDCPTLVMVGAHDLSDVIESADYLADRLSDRPVAVIENAAHLPSLEQPIAFNDVLQPFLQGI